MTCHSISRTERKEATEAAEMLRHYASPQSVALLAFPLIQHTDFCHTTSRLDIEILCKQLREEAFLPTISSLSLPKEKLPFARHKLDSIGVVLSTPVNWPDGNCDYRYIKQETLIAIASGADEVEIYTPCHIWLQNFVARNAWDTFLEECARYRMPSTIILETDANINGQDFLEMAKNALSFGFDTIKTSLAAPTTTPEILETLLDAFWLYGIERDKRLTIGGTHLTLQQTTSLLADIMKAGIPLDASRVRLSSPTLLFEARTVLENNRLEDSEAGVSS